eukprot:CAMPEP_0118704394 /NCGR_PEP_ID=MMETSP0800-20121206/19211_1 /TAXON_ID=210618 ORGANISM="Striatella unipunctata, Strain CCMP2910" /NCGR_SAMPLE_ID=MMETSP0800 /ASSEMBLY_ACC=CAM_ASM_000638 /LENGTH=470 /DNA_ID=CAMNT_0006606279 /DNA_START=151 /DNA_END=1560 /DNA_ORIENTATION=+
MIVTILSMERAILSTMETNLRPWPMVHRSTYAQASSPYPGLMPEDDIKVDYEFAITIPGTLSYTSLDYAAGNRAIWYNNAVRVGKMDVSSRNDIKDIDNIFLGGPTDQVLSTAYSLLDVDGIYYHFYTSHVYAYTNALIGDVKSDIIEIRRLNLRTVPGLLKSERDLPVGLSITYDGYLAFATREGNLAIMTRTFTNIQIVNLGQGEEVSNGIACDEDGGIYVVTSKHMHRVQWNGSVLHMGWTADYEVGPEKQVGGRIGAGSGSTPSLMGTGADRDKFVVITDGQELMHIVLFWRDEIPHDWVPIGPGKDIRIAAEVPVRFGDINAKTSVSEQSLTVRGYGVMTVNNDYGFRGSASLPETVDLLRVTFTNLRRFAPYGAERFQWDPTTRRLRTVWANREVSCPNGIPSMSAASNMAYCIGQRNSVWTLEGMDWDTGESRFYKRLGLALRYNSFYSAIVVGPNREMASGT